MTPDELNEFLEANPHFVWSPVAMTDSKEPALYFRNTILPWYNETNEKGDFNSTKVTVAALNKLSVQDFVHQINKGLDVECITRITGYMAKTRGFNPGKTQELKDRVRVTVGEEGGDKNG